MTIMSESRSELDRLAAETPFLEADALAHELQVQERRNAYKAGHTQLADVVQAEAAREASKRRQNTHLTALAELQAKHDEAETKAQIGWRIGRLDGTRRRLTKMELEAARRLEAAEAELHAARFEVRQSYEEARTLRSTGLNDLAQLCALLGVPSPAVRKLTPAEQAEYDDRRDWWRLAPENGLIDRPDQDLLHTPPSKVDAQDAHRARWRWLQIAADAWPKVKPPEEK